MTLPDASEGWICPSCGQPDGRHDLGCAVLRQARREGAAGHTLSEQGLAAAALRDKKMTRIILLGTVGFVLLIAIGVAVAIHRDTGERSCAQKTEDAGLSRYTEPGSTYERLCLQQEGRK